MKMNKSKPHLTLLAWATRKLAANNITLEQVILIITENTEIDIFKFPLLLRFPLQTLYPIGTALLLFLLMQL
jgi:hypothetical protein